MKNPWSVLLVMLIPTAFLRAEEAGKHLFILSGQSNMARMDHTLSFVPTVEEAFGKENVIVVKIAQGGQPIRRWYKNWKPAEGGDPGETGGLYTLLIKRVRELTEGEKIKTVTFVWMQGERDAKEEHDRVYEASLKGLIQQLGGDLGRTDIHIVIGRLSDAQMTNPHWVAIRDAQMKVAEESKRGVWVNTDDLNDGENKRGQPVQNDLHYTPEGYKIFGKRLAEAAIILIRL